MENEITEVVKTPLSVQIQNDLDKIDPNNIPSIWEDAAAFELALKQADFLSRAEITPAHYKGKKADCLIAVDIAHRLGISPVMVTQNSQVVYGNFTWKGQAYKGMIDGCGLFEGLSSYVMTGTKGEDSWGCYVRAIDRKTGKEINGPEVTIAMAKAEGWYGKNGSKWKTMPELMLEYRAAAFFVRTQCPSLTMGYLSTEEMEDVGKAEPKTADLLKAEIEEENKNNA